MQTYLRLLRENPQYAKLWAAQVVSLLGDWFNTVVLSALVALYSDGSGLAVSIFLLARFLPPLLIGPYAGVLVDRYNRQHILVWCNVLRAGVVPFFLLAQSPDMLWLIYVVTIVQFALSAFFEPAQSAIIPALTRPQQLVEANTLVSITWSVMLALGAVLGGAFAALFGTAAALMFDAFTFLVASGLLAWIHYQPLTNGSPQHRQDTTFVDGLRFLRENPPMRWALFIKIGTHLGNADTLMTILATQVFVLGAQGELSLGVLYSVFGVGAFIAPLLLNRWNDGTVARMRRLVLLGFALSALSWFVIAVAGTFTLLAVGFFVRAIGGSANWTYSTIIIQKSAPDAYLGRMFALDMAGFQLVTVLSTLAHGALVDALGVQNVVLVLVGTGLVCLLPWALWAWAVPRLERQAALAAAAD